MHTLCFGLVFEAVKSQQRNESIDPAPSGRIYQSDNQPKWSKKFLSTSLTSQIATKEAEINYLELATSEVRTCELRRNDRARSVHVF